MATVYHRAVQQPDVETALTRAAAALARGADLETMLARLATELDGLGGGSGAAILIHDQERALLVSADGAATVAVMHGTECPVARAIHDRLPRWSAETAPAFVALTPGAPRQAVLPLVIHDELGVGVEGVALVGTGSAGPDAHVHDALLAVADLIAVAVRMARLQSAIAEGSDYLERLSRTDPLTGLVDRRTFDQVLELEVVRATRQKSALVVVLVDVDSLGAINETHGSDVGDDVLRQVAAGIASLVRLIDTVARLDSDTIGVIGPGDELGVVGRRIRDMVAALPPVGPVRASVSVGIAHHPADGATGDELVAAAQAALDEAKRAGAGSVAGSRETA